MNHSSAGISITYQRVIAGILASTIGGLVSGFAVALPHGFGLNLVFAIALGILFGLVFGFKIQTAGGGLVWGTSAGILWWLLGSLTLIPLFFDGGLRWTSGAIQEAFPELLAQVFGFGAVMGMVFHWLMRWLNQMMPEPAPTASAGSERRIPSPHEVLPPQVQSLVVGGIGGLLGSWIFALGIDSGNFYPLVAELLSSNSPELGRFLHYAIGTVIGISFGFFFRRDVRGPGSGLAWGTLYGLVWWVLGPLTMMPLFLGGELDWSLNAARGLFPSLISHILYGALVGYVCGLVGKLWQVLFIDSDPLNRDPEGAGTRGVRGLIMGIAGGIIGGLIFTFVMVSVGALPAIATLVGSSSAVLGFVIHLLISMIIGVSYGLLFQKEAYNYGSGLAWGMLYGMYWWILGSLTLFPILLRTPPDWSLPTVIAQYPSLVGHLMYGAGLGLFFQYLAHRYDAELSGRAQLGRQGTHVTRPRRRLAGTPAPALWGVTLLLGVILPLLLSV